MVGIAVAIGVAGAAGAIVFRVLIRFFQGAFFEGLPGVEAMLGAGLFADPRGPLEAARALSGWTRALIPAAGGLIVGPLVYYFAREAAATADLPVQPSSGARTAFMDAGKNKAAAARRSRSRQR